MRHGIAADEADEGDAARPLTARGRERTLEVVAGLERLKLKGDHVYTSPLRRAIETASLLGPINRGGVTVLPELGAPPSPGLLAELTYDRAILVGHMPWLAELCGIVTLGVPEGGAALDWRKGGVAWLVGDLRPAGMALRAFLPPRILRHP